MRTGLKVNRIVLFVFSVFVLAIINILSSFLVNTRPQSLIEQCLLFGICSLVILVLLSTIYDRSYMQYERDTMGQMLAEQDRQRKISQQTIDITLISPRTTQHFSKIIRRDITPEFNFHSLRKTHASMLAEKGVDQKYIQTRLGHANIDIAINVYESVTGLMRERGRDALNKLYQ